MPDARARRRDTRCRSKTGVDAKRFAPEWGACLLAIGLVACGGGNYGGANIGASSNAGSGTASGTDASTGTGMSTSTPTTGGSTEAAGSYARCLPSALKVGSTLDIAMKTSQSGEVDFRYRFLGPADFAGLHTMAHEVTTNSVGSTAVTVTTDYEDSDATGAVTQYGEVVQTAAGTGTSKGTTVFQPPMVAPAFVAGQVTPITVNANTQTIERTVNGASQTTTTQTLGGGKYDLTFVGIESVTVPAGTFDACRIETTFAPTLHSTVWLLADYGATIKGITTNGSIVDTSVADSVLLDGTPVH